MSQVIDSKLSSDSHIFAKGKKANTIIAVFRKTFIQMTRPVFLNVHRGLIWPHLEFCDQACDPRLEKNTRFIENEQRRMTRMVQGLQTLSYNERLKKLELPSNVVIIVVILSLNSLRFMTGSRDRLPSSTSTSCCSHCSSTVKPKEKGLQCDRCDD